MNPRVLLGGLALASAASSTFAHSTASDFADLSLEELMNETVTSVSKRAQRLEDAASAVFVLTGEDLRRSGATHLPDTLRLVPGMNVASVNSHQWAVSARGFDAVYGNKLLVLVDGRTVYNPFFSGVLWDFQQTPLHDLDRIEIIRGPGATLWGANAVNGVVNIVSRDARDTLGGLLHVGAGDVEKSYATVRYGGRIDDNTFYRVFASQRSRDDFTRSDGTSANDDWRTVHGGFRLDRHTASDTHLTWQADATRIDHEGGASHGVNVNTLARLTHDDGAGSVTEFQAYYDRIDRIEPTRMGLVIDTFDLSYQNTRRLTDRDILTWGLGYRYANLRLEETSPAIVVHDETVNLSLFSGFVQNEYELLPDRLTITAGVKLEQNDFTGFEFQPSVRAAYKPAANQTVWAAISRAVRTPNLVESGNAVSFITGPPVTAPGGPYTPVLTTDADPDAEVLWAYEFGYRLQPSARVKIDVSTFHNHYAGLIGYRPPSVFIPGTALIPTVNALDARSYGGELSALFVASDTVRLRGGYSILVLERMNIPGAITGNQEFSPKHQASLGVSWDFIPRAGVDLHLRYVGRSPDLPDYFTADLRLSYRPTAHLELALVAQNLIEPDRIEHGFEYVTTSTEVPRTVHASLTWRF